MPLYKTGTDRYEKWDAKFVAETISARITQVRDIAAKRAQAGLNLYQSIEELVRPILDSYGLVGTGRALALAFARKLARHALRQKGSAGSTMATAIKSEFVAMGLDPAVADEIIQVVVGWTVPY